VTAAILKITKLRHLSNTLTDLRKIWHASLEWRPSTDVKNLNFQNLRWWTAAILKAAKSPYILNRLTDFDEIWQDDTSWPLLVG